MQSAIVAALKASWPLLEPLLLKALVSIAGELVALAKSGKFPSQWKWAEPVIAAAGDEMLKLLPSA